MNSMIRIENVSYEYRTQSENYLHDRAVDKLTAEVKQGEFVVILGRNGSGKSTLARLLNALLIPVDGTIYIDGMDTRDSELTWNIRKNLGLVFQNPDNQIVSTTVEEDVAFGPENLGVPPHEIRERVDYALKVVGMEDYSKHSPHMLSGGQKQRIAIAGILAMEPKCIVLDEATSMLDPQGRKEVMTLLHKLNKEKGITIVLITHHMTEATYADRVIIMQGGRIVLEGTPRKIFEQIDTVRNAGLDVPKVTDLAYKLKHRGFDITGLPITKNEMVAIINSLISNNSVKNLSFSSGLARETRFDLIGLSTAKDIIKVEDLNYVYMPETTYEKKALKNINLTVKEGEILGVIGHTGSGKSTLVQHFNGILKPTSGVVEVDGQPATGKNLRDLRKKVGLIFQYPEQQLFEETVYKDIIFGLQKMDLSEEEIKKRVFHVIDLLGISPELLEKSPFELSGGQKRRVAIAGVLIMEPKVLVLDEPTAGLDPNGSQELFSILTELNRKEGTTIVLISHSMDDIAQYCHRVAVMKNGELIMCDAVEKVFLKAEQISSIGLDIPQITELFNNLAQRINGLPLPVLTVDHAVEILEIIVKSAGGGRL
ncbi:MAG: energy-coupling factor transporter ATPase [Clostridiaceae bacterium]|nr:energy-coupling factor transporter ATPase [Clostridiaceae bacterium]